MVGALNMISVAFCGAVCRSWRRFWNSVFGCATGTNATRFPGFVPALSQAAKNAGVPLTLASSGGCGGISVVPADRLPGRLRVRPDCRRRHADCLSDQHYTASRAVDGHEPARRTGSHRYRSLAPVDRFLQVHRVPVIAGTVGIAVLGLPLLYFLTFDFDPIHLRSPKTESISTLLELGEDPRVGINSINVIVPSLGEANAAAAQLEKLPQVLRAMTSKVSCRWIRKRNGRRSANSREASARSCSGQPQASRRPMRKMSRR